MELVLGSHQQALLQDARCGWCAERVPYRLLLGGGTCPHCDSTLRVGDGAGAAQVIEQASS
jgi:hypothetical protein